jgi:nucleotide-binding universal stress UspA family protein
MFKTIVTANDGTDQALRAFALALTLATENSAELHMISVEQISYNHPEASGSFHGVVNRARAIAEERQVKLKTHVVVGSPMREIIVLARNLSADLLVIGARGYSALYERIIGSIGSRADRIVHLASCPVLVVK